MIVGSTRAVPVIINEVSLSSLPLPLLSSPGEETQCTLNILLSSLSLSPVVVAGAVVHITVNGFGGAAVGGGGGGGDISPLQFPNSERARAPICSAAAAACRSQSNRPNPKVERSERENR